MVFPSGVRPLELEDPAEIGGHPLAGRLGSGGMGVVYLGHDRHGRFVAVKAAHTETTGDDEVRRRFRAEAACARRVPPACTARLLVDGTDQTPPYIISEYVEGRSLEHVVDNDGPLPPEQLHALATGVARGLAAIHWVGLIHRDLKPANVLLTPTGPRVIDFGIAQQIPASGGVTGTGMVVGSPGWIPPERLTRSPATPASDVFGWGCLIAYAGTGRNPFGQGDSDEVARRTIGGPPDLDGLDDSLRRLVEATLAKDPAERPSAGELLARLSPAGPLADPEPRGRSATKVTPVPARRRRVKALAAGSAAVAVAATLTAVVVTDADRTVRRKPGGAAVAPPALAAETDRPAAPRARPSAREHTNPASMPGGSPVTHPPARTVPVTGKRKAGGKKQDEGHGHDQGGGGVQGGGKGNRNGQGDG
jgi:predicted Ser/Thr protein kinase